MRSQAPGRVAARSRRGRVLGRTFAQKQQLDNKAGRRFDQKVYGFELGATMPSQDSKGGSVGGLLGIPRTGAASSMTAPAYRQRAYRGLRGIRGGQRLLFDSTLRASRFENDFAVTAERRLHTGQVPGQWGRRQLEAGKRFTLHDGWFVEPQSEVSLFHTSGGTYRAANNLSVKDEGRHLRRAAPGSLAAGRRIELGKDRVFSPMPP